MTNELVKTGSGQLALANLSISAVALAVLKKTSNAGFGAEEFLGGISNEHTRRAYGRIVNQFLVWCQNYEGRE